MKELAELEELVHTYRGTISNLVALDGKERWGMRGAGPEEIEQHAREVADQQTIERDTKARFEAVAIAARMRDPARLAAWIDRRIAALRATIEGTDRERVVVAETERAILQWTRLAAGAANFVDENPVYVASVRVAVDD